jgi:hypothetical protein
LVHLLAVLPYLIPGSHDRMVAVNGGYKTLGMFLARMKLWEMKLWERGKLLLLYEE